MDIWGLCPSCDRWFACHQFYDQTVPLPTCPMCALAPAKLSYGERPVTRSHGERQAGDLYVERPARASHEAVSELWVG